MSDMAKNLYSDILKEYQNRLDEGQSTQCVAFDNSIFIEKYGYSAQILNNLLTELHDLGYIENWIIGGFQLNID